MIYIFNFLLECQFLYRTRPIFEKWTELSALLSYYM